MRDGYDGFASQGTGDIVTDGWGCGAVAARR